MGISPDNQARLDALAMECGMGVLDRGNISRDVWLIWNNATSQLAARLAQTSPGLQSEDITGEVARVDGDSLVIEASAGDIVLSLRVPLYSRPPKGQNADLGTAPSTRTAGRCHSGLVGRMGRSWGQPRDPGDTQAHRI